MKPSGWCAIDDDTVDYTNAAVDMADHAETYARCEAAEVQSQHE